MIGMGTDAVRTRLYLCGKMLGEYRYNFPLFDQARDRLREMGYDVVSPADLDRAAGLDADALPQDWDWSAWPEGLLDKDEVIRQDVAALLSCDAVFCVTDTGGDGFAAEIAVARWAGRPVWRMAELMAMREGAQ